VKVDGICQIAYHSNTRKLVLVLNLVMELIHNLNSK